MERSADVKPIETYSRTNGMEEEFGMANATFQKDELNAFCEKTHPMHNTFYISHVVVAVAFFLSISPFFGMACNIKTCEVYVFSIKRYG